jgi:CO/xanthine dehydrogenase FAD-binding subunit
VESFLKGKALNPETVDQAVELAPKEAKPLKTSLYSPSHKRKLMGILLRGVLQETIGKVNG